MVASIDMHIAHPTGHEWSFLPAAFCASRVPSAARDLQDANKLYMWSCAHSACTAWQQQQHAGSISNSLADCHAIRGRIKGLGCLERIKTKKGKTTPSGVQYREA